MKVSIVIPNWNGEEKLKRNLPSVLKVKGVDEVIVVDDGSLDESIKVLEESFPEVVLIKKSKNSGFSSTVNLGVKSANGELIFLLNNDAVPTENSLEEVLPHFKEVKVFSVGCNSGGSFAFAYFKDGFLVHNQAEEISDKTHQTLWVSGGSGVFRKSIWQALGGMDTLFNPFYWEDLDLGYRATKRGYLNLWEPKSKVEHYHQGVTSGDKQMGVIKQNFSKGYIDKISQRNQLIFNWKNITSTKMLNEHKVALIKRVITHPGYLFIILEALLKYPQIMDKRQKEKDAAKLTDEQVLALFSS